MSTPTLDKSIDCGTSACVQIKLSRNTWSGFLYKNIITADGVLTLTPYNIHRYIDKVVRVRTPMGCENPDKPCATCDSQILWTKDTSPPDDLMKSHKRPTSCHKLGTSKMLAMRTVDKITRDGDVIMKTAEQLHDEICLRGIDNYTKAELRVMCQAILNAPGDRAGAIAAGKRYGWWDDSVAESCQAILKAPGNRAMAIALAKCDGWWDDSVAEPCQAIMAAPILSDRGTAIAHAKRKGWWKDPNQDNRSTVKPKTAEAIYAEVCEAGVNNHTRNQLDVICRAIKNAPGNRACIIAEAKTYGWWEDVIAEPCLAILNAPGDRAWAIYSAKQAGWWNDAVAEPCKAIMEAPGNRDLALTAAKQCIWWKEPKTKEVAMEALDLFNMYRRTMTPEEVAELCRQILKAEGDQAFAIYYAKTAGWWLDSVAEPCQAIMKGLGNCACAIACAKTAGWWDDSVANPCQVIMEVPGNSPIAATFAEAAGWWKEPHVLSKNDIGLGNIPINTSTIVTPTRDITIKEAWDRLTRAMTDDPEWAWSVQCNIAMPIMDHLQCNRKDANTAASVLMQHLFHYDITGHKCYQDIINCPVAMSPEQSHMIDDQQRRVVESDKQPKRLKLGKVVLLHEPVEVATVNNPVEETYIVNQLKQRYPLSDNFDPDYAKFGITNKHDFVRGRLTPVNPEIPFHQKVKEYFIEHAYYSNSKYPSTLFMIGESLNNDSVLFKTLKVGSWETSILIILNDDLNLDDFKLVLNPANEAIEETSTTCDASDFLSDLTNRIKEHRSIGSELCDKDCIVKGTKVNPIAAHREKVLSFFKHGMTYLKKHRGDVYYTYRDDMSSYKRLVFECKSTDCADATFRTVDIERIDLNDWQAVEGNSNVNRKCYPHEEFRAVINNEQSFEKTISFTDDVVRVCRKHNVSLITAQQSTISLDKLPPIETTVDPITSCIKQLNPETKESLLKFLEIRNFFKPQGVYKNKRYNDGSFYIYQERQPRFDNLSFKRKNQGHYDSWTLNINCIDIDDWVLLGIESSHIDSKELLCQKVKAFFKPGRIYCNPKGSFAGCCFEFYEIKESQFDIIRCKRHFFNNNPSEENTILVDNIKFEDWTDMSDITTSFQEYNSKFLIPGHIYCKMDNRDVLRFERKIPSLQSKVILRFRRVPNNEIVEFTTDEFRRDVWEDITYKLYQ